MRAPIVNQIIRLIKTAILPKPVVLMKKDNGKPITNAKGNAIPSLKSKKMMP